MKIKLISMDPAMSNLGIALGTYDTDSDKFEVQETRLVQTENQAGKTVRKSSDDLRRAKALYEGMIDACKGASIAIAEIPTGTQSARGAMSNGMCVGVLAACPLPMIEVSPTEAKMAALGIKTASKGEMIEWAMARYPTANWLMRKSKGVMVPMNDNEHMADALAIMEAGIKSSQFKTAMKLLAASKSISTEV